MEKIPPLVFHADWFDIIEDLPQEQQLEAYRAIMLYAFKGEKSSHPIAMAATALMRRFIDADRSKYADICKKRKEAIQRRWKAQKNTSDTNVYNSIQKNTSDTNTNTNTNNQDQDYNQDQYQKQRNINIPLQTNNKRVRECLYVSPSLNDQIAECKVSQIWKDGIRKKFHLKDDAEVDALLDDFAVDMVCQETEVRNAKKFFMTWLSERQQKKRDSSRNNRESGLGVGEWRDDKGRRRYAKSDVIVPESASPRPSAAHWWSNASKQWEKQI